MRTKVMTLGSILLFSMLWTATAIGNPIGSYEKTCTNIKLDGETLSATCKRFDGSTKNSVLEFATSCVGVISNVDGNLACTGPTGSFYRTCRNTRVENGMVYSTCQRINGTWMDTSVSFSGYLHPITNCDGKLVDKATCN